jgi:hypothetical protein
MKDFLSKIDPKILKIGGVSLGGIALMVVAVLVITSVAGDYQENPGTPASTRDSENTQDTNDTGAADPCDDCGALPDSCECSATGTRTTRATVISIGSELFDASGNPIASESLLTNNSGDIIGTMDSGGGTATFRDPIITGTSASGTTTPGVSSGSGSASGSDTTSGGGGTTPPPAPVVGGGTITLNGNSATFTGNGIVVTGSLIEIILPGNYTVSGTLRDGQLRLVHRDAAGQRISGGNVGVTLNNASLTSSDGPALRISEGWDTVTVTNAAGTTNRVVDSRPQRPSAEELDGIDNEDLDDNHRRNAAIYSNNSPLIITGGGELRIAGGFAHGINVNGSSLTIRDARITVENAWRNAIRAQQDLRVEKSDINVISANRALRSTGNNRGNIVIHNSTVKAVTGDDAIHATTMLFISDSNIDLLTGGGWEYSRDDDVRGNNATGLRNEGAEHNIILRGGTFNLDCAGVPVLTTGHLTVDGSTMNIITGAQRNALRGRSGIEVRNANIVIERCQIGFRAGGERHQSRLHIIDSQVNVKSCRVGVQGAHIVLEGGHVRVRASGQAIGPYVTLRQNPRIDFAE